jgi:hypothetical protein
MIDVSSETVVSLTEASKHVPSRRQGKKTAVSTIWRWAMKGIRGVKLETIMIGGTRCTSLQALQRFFEQVTEVTNGTTAMPSTSRRRQSQLQAAEAELEAAGI